MVENNRKHFFFQFILGIKKKGVLDFFKNHNELQKNAYHFML